MRRQTFFLLSLLFHLLLLLLLLHTPLDPSIRTLLAPSPPLEVVLIPQTSSMDPLAAPVLPPPSAPARTEAPPQTPSEDIPVIIRPFTLGDEGQDAVPESESTSGITGAPQGHPPDNPAAGDVRSPNASPPVSGNSVSKPTREELFAMGEALNKSLSRPDLLHAPGPDGPGRFSSATFGYPAGRSAPGKPWRGPGSGDGKTATAGGAVFNSYGYDITPWARRVVYRIKKNWIIPATADLGIRGEVRVYAVIRKNGDLARIELRNPSLVTEFNRSALGAIQNSAPFPYLPGDFPYPSVDGLIIFHFN